MTKKKKIKVTFTIPTLTAGGAERVLSYISQNLNKKKFEVTLLVIGKQKDAVYSVEGINLIFLEKDRVRDAIVNLAKYLKLKRPDVVISAIAHLNTVMALMSIFYPNIKFVGRETNVKSVNAPKKKNLSINMMNIQKLFLDAIICQSEDMKADLIENYNMPEKQLITIHNPVNDEFNVKQTVKSVNFIKFITVGRLAKHKGHIRILNALSRFEEPFKYSIIGSGSYLKEITTKVQELGLQDKVEFIEFTDKVANYLQAHDIFLHGSFVEGFPNSMLESCAVGTPVVTFNAPGGINEIIESGINGFIAHDEADFLKAIRKVVSAKFLSPEKIRKSVVDKYSTDKILKDYERFISQIVGGKEHII